jgi:hypothetical protein
VLERCRLNDADFKEAMFLLGELNAVELYGLIFALLSEVTPKAFGSGFEMKTLRHLIDVVKKQREKV